MSIINTWDQCVAAGGDRIFLSYAADSSGRGSFGSRWVVIRIKNGVQMTTHPDGNKAPWYQRGCIWFSTYGSTKAAVLPVALEWISKRYGERTFARNRLGDYVEKDVNDRFPIPKEDK